MDSGTLYATRITLILMRYEKKNRGARRGSMRLCIEPERFAPAFLALAPSVSGDTTGKACCKTFQRVFRNRVLLPESFIWQNNLPDLPLRCPAYDNRASPLIPFG